MYNEFLLQQYHDIMFLLLYNHSGVSETILVVYVLQ